MEQVAAVQRLESSMGRAMVAVLTDASALSMPSLVDMLRAAPALSSSELVVEALDRLRADDLMLWTRTPNGRFSVTKIDRNCDSDGAWRARWGVAEAAGWEVIGLVVEAGRVREMEIPDGTRVTTAKSRAALETAIEPLRRNVWDFERTLCTEIRVGDLQRLGVGDQVPWVVRHMEAMASSKDSLKQHGGRLMVTFEGYEANPTEVWDCLRVQSFMRRLVDAVPWWPCLIHRTHAFVWVAASLPHTGTRYLQDGEVFVDMAPLDARKAIVGWCSEAVGVIADSGLQQDGFRILDTTIRPLLGFAQRFETQAYAVSKGSVRLLDDKPQEIDPVTWHKKFMRNEVSESGTR